VDGSPGIAQKIRDLGYSLSATGKEVLGLDHAELSGRILTHWKLSENLMLAVRHHPDPLCAHPCKQLAAYVHVGDLIARAVILGD